MIASILGGPAILAYNSAGDLQQAFRPPVEVEVACIVKLQLPEGEVTVYGFNATLLDHVPGKKFGGGIMVGRSLCENPCPGSLVVVGGETFEATGWFETNTALDSMVALPPSLLAHCGGSRLQARIAWSGDFQDSGRRVVSSLLGPLPYVSVVLLLVVPGLAVASRGDDARRVAATLDAAGYSRAYAAVVLGTAASLGSLAGTLAALAAAQTVLYAVGVELPLAVLASAKAFLVLALAPFTSVITVWLAGRF